MTEAGGMGDDTPPATPKSAMEVSDSDWLRLAGDLAQAGAARGLHDAHVVAWSTQRLATLALRCEEVSARVKSAPTPKETRRSLEAIAAQAQALAGMLEELSPSARAHFKQGQFRVCQGRDDGEQWALDALQTIGNVASAAAAGVPVRPGRARAMGHQRLLCADIDRIVGRHGLTLSQGGAFYRICKVMFSLARIPALPRDAIRSLQDIDPQRKAYQAWMLLQLLGQERE